MEGFYVIFDRAQRRVGFAVSPCAGKRNIVQDLVSEETPALSEKHLCHLPDGEKHGYSWSAKGIFLSNPKLFRLQGEEKESCIAHNSLWHEVNQPHL